MMMSPAPVPSRPVRVACLGRACLVDRPSGVGGSDAAVRCDSESARDRATFATEAATRAWIAAQDPPPPYLRLGQQLRAGHQALPGLSVALLAAAVDVTPATIYQYEAGHHAPTAPPSTASPRSSNSTPPNCSPWPVTRPPSHRNNVTIP